MCGPDPLTGNKQTHKNHANNIGLLFTVMDKIGDPPPGMTHHQNPQGVKSGSDKNNKWHTIEFSNNIRTP